MTSNDISTSTEQRHNANDLLGILAGIMLVVTYSCGILPIFIRDRLQSSQKSSSRWLSLLSCFSGGVFLGTTFLDVVPHILGGWRKLRTNGYVTTSFPMGEYMMCVGFFFVYLLEQSITALFMHRDRAKASPETPKMLPVNDTEEDDEEYFGERRPTIHEAVIEEAAKYAVSDTSHSIVKTITFTFAISFHSILEGFALGVQDTRAGIWSLFTSLILHKGVEAFSVGLQVMKGHKKRCHFMLTVAIYSIMTPLGIGLGMMLQGASFDRAVKDPLTSVLESMATGTFMYVTFLEILAEEKAKEELQRSKLLAIFLGFSVISGLQFVFDS